MSKYSDWYSTQSPAFIKELTNGTITHKFIDRNIRAISIEQLESLDNKFIHAPAALISERTT